MKLCDGPACGRIAVIAMALIGGGTAAPAATPLYWPGGDLGYDRTLYDTPEPPRRRVIRQPRMPKDEAAKAEKLAQGSAKPSGPLVVAISLAYQTMKVYDANGLFAETPISSGVKGHATPMGVFSVIQKNKWHRSNIYSGAPMPFMQRLTWSGIALHAGIVPGHPASHGCVRMPMAFAVRMWGWTRMGARVVITPGEISPTSVAHPLLASLRAPAPVASVPAAPSMKAADSLPAANTKTADASNSVAGATASDAQATRPPVPASDSQSPAAGDKPAATEALPAATRGGGPIALFVSRKDGKLYVRQNFTPLFDVPVTISGDAPIGTHVFTAYPDKDITKPVQWTALTLPASARMHEPLSHRRQGAGAGVAAPEGQQASATEALDRLKVPDDALARLGGLSAGSSLIVSDQGITASGETGLGTDFIVRLR